MSTAIQNIDSKDQEISGLIEALAKAIYVADNHYEFLAQDLKTYIECNYEGDFINDDFNHVAQAAADMIKINLHIIRGYGYQNKVFSPKLKSKSPKVIVLERQRNGAYEPLPFNSLTLTNQTTVDNTENLVDLDSTDDDFFSHRDRFR